MPPPRPSRIDKLQKALLEWFEQNRRDLPWRRRRDPYAVWISEIMLQQTRVDQAVPYFDRFMKLFPNLEALARAPLDAVMKAWEGMGYYSRARNLHSAAGEFVSVYGGKLPETADELARLPGIGRYTAGAISSLAFGRDEPVLDGNVARVLCRVFALESDPSGAAGKKMLWELARRLLPPGRAGLFNEALMELGALVCIPRGPACASCPWSRSCSARRRKAQAFFPRTGRRASPPRYQEVAALIWKKDRVLIDRRPPKGLLGGLWELPGGPLETGESAETTLLRHVEENVGIRVRIRGRERPIEIEQAYSHKRVILRIFECEYVSGRIRPRRCSAVRWICPREIDRYPFSRVIHKTFAAFFPS